MIAHVWLRCHRSPPIFWLLLAVGWTVCGFIAGIGVPDDLIPVEQRTGSLNSTAVVATAAVAAISIWPAEDAVLWPRAVSPRNQPALRALWIGVMILFTAPGIMLAVYFVPSEVSTLTFFLPVIALWWGVSLWASVVLGRTASFLLPLVLAVVSATGLIPVLFEFFYADSATQPRLIAALISAATSVCAYVLWGTGTERRGRTRDL